MTFDHRKTAALLGLLLLTACEGWAPPQPQPQSKIIATYDATYIKPVGGDVEHIVPGGPVIDQRTADRITALEQRVGVLESQVTALTPLGAHMVPVDLNQKGDVAPDTLPVSGLTAPVPDAVPATPLAPDSSGADAAPTALTPAASAPTHSRHSENVTTGKGAVLQALRVGEHPGLTRIVLDSSQKRAFHTDLDNDEHILTIEVAGAKWGDGKEEHKTPKSPLLSSWQAAPDGAGGTRFAVQLRKNAKIASSQTLPGAAGKPARIVIDLAAS